MGFDRDAVAALAAAEEVEIETRSATGEPRRTVIWIVERDGELYARSFRGDRGVWYREALADPSVALHLDGRRVDARAVPATDPASVAACSEGLREKYRRSYSLAAMLVPAVLPTTLKLVPA